MIEEKKKRGRPKKITIEELKAAFVPDPKSEDASGPKFPRIQDDVDFKKGMATPERSYPSNWGEMGKIDRLKWLTANK